ncbi:MAG: cation transporter, partial [Gammaproteobacteria bacterium]
DPLLALVVAGILGRGAWTLLRDSGHILLEGVPPGIDLPRVADVLAHEVPDVIEIHHVHAWALTAEKPLLTLHATIRPEADLERVMAAIKRTLHEYFGIDHSTVQVEHGSCPDDH